MKYGYRKGPRCLIEFPVGASEVFKRDSANLVISDGAGTGRVIPATDAGQAKIIGWAYVSKDFTTPASPEGADKVAVDISFDSVYEIPANAAVSASLVGHTCDIVVTDNVCKANVSGITYKVIQILAVDVAKQSVFARLVAKNITVDAVA